MGSYLDNLNPPQKEAVQANLGNMLVLAGAGSGKTKVLVSRIAWLAENFGLPLSGILAVTFTNKAAGEMRSRLHSILEYPVSNLWVGTFHGICHRFLRIHWREAGLTQQFHIMDSEDQARVIKRIIASMKLDEDAWPVKQAQSFINAQKDEGLRPEHVHVANFGPGKTLLQIYAAYEQACQTAGVVDFADLVLKTLELFRNNPELLQQYRQKFHAILVDEFQDTNTVQYALIRILASDTCSVMVVGDDDQSIYGWRGARVENILQFPKDFKDTKIIRLEQNYRSTATILEAANYLITHNFDRMGKELWTAGERGPKIKVYTAYNELDEARYIADSMKTEWDGGHNYDEMAILYRSNAQSRVLEEALIRANIPYRIYGGLRFFDRAEIKDALAYMRLLVNRNDDSAFERIVNFPTRGIGDKTLDLVHLKAQTLQISFWQAANLILQEAILPARAHNALSDFITLIQGIEDKIKGLTLDKQFETIIHFSGLHACFSKIKGEKSESKIENLNELINAASEFSHDQISEDNLMIEFLSHASLEAGEAQAKDFEKSVHLMTLHAAKGLEFPIVYLAGMEEGVFPTRQSMQEPAKLEEERRLCYVGMTRAMQQLVLSHAEVRRQYGREERYKFSRFLKELPEDLLEWRRVQTRFEVLHSPKTTTLKRPENEQGLYPGQNVNHPKFGTGVVLALEGSGAHTRVLVKFASDKKWLVLAYANLEKIA